MSWIVITVTNQAGKSSRMCLNTEPITSIRERAEDGTTEIFYENEFWAVAHEEFYTLMEGLKRVKEKVFYAHEFTRKPNRKKKNHKNSNHGKILRLRTVEN